MKGSSHSAPLAWINILSVDCESLALGMARVKWLWELSKMDGWSSANELAHLTISIKYLVIGASVPRPLPPGSSEREQVSTAFRASHRLMERSHR